MSRMSQIRVYMILCFELRGCPSNNLLKTFHVDVSCAVTTGGRDDSCGVFKFISSKANA
jgi:hypothetical protein